MISASHNPYQDNGIKFFSSDGYKLPDAVEDRIENLIASGELPSLRAGADDIGRAQRIDDAQGRYVVFLKKSFAPDLSLDGLRVVLDCANGAAYQVGPDGAPRARRRGLPARRRPERPQHQRRLRLAVSREDRGEGARAARRRRDRARRRRRSRGAGVREGQRRRRRRAARAVRRATWRSAARCGAARWSPP